MAILLNLVKSCNIMVVGGFEYTLFIITKTYNDIIIHIMNVDKLNNH